MSLSDERLREIATSNLEMFEKKALAQELLSRREQDEAIGKVVEWAAEQKCKCILSGPYRGAKCPPCLARTLQSKRKGD